MNWEHLRAFLWLHSRISFNKSRQTGRLSIAIHNILWILGILAAGVTFSGSLLAGLYPLAGVPAQTVLFVWDGVVAIFLFFWLLILSTELQRSELLPLEKFMQYPISVSSLFLINYVASILSEHVAMVFFFPAMVGLSIGLVFSRGIAMLWLFPLVAAFILMVTAVTYQFRGWLAVVMLNKRHRRNVITIVTVVTIVIFQLPAMSSRIFGSRRSRSAPVTNAQQIGRIATIASMVVPVGWLPYGAGTTAEGRFLPSALGIAGMTLIGAISLRRSYRTTVRLYTGNYGSGKTRSKQPGASTGETVQKVAATARVNGMGGSLLEMKIPWVSEQASVVAAATFRSLMRAPEVKMVLISPLIMALFFGAPMLRLSSNPSEFSRPIMVSMVLLMILFSTGQLTGNQFAFDRSGFRNFVLSSASRRDILLGKNLGIAPVTLGIAAAALLLLQYFRPMRMDHFVGVLFQMVTMFLLNCLLANFLSIVNPHSVAAGSLRPAVKPSGKTILLSMLSLVLFPLSVAPSMIPLGLEYGAHWMGWYTGIPIFLVLSVIEAIAVASLYWWVLDREGEMLQSRELKILDVVAARAAED